MTIHDRSYFNEEPIPVVVFIFNRPDFASLQADFLRKISTRRVFVVSDGWRTNAEKTLVVQARNNLSSVEERHQVEWICSRRNLGLELRFFTALDFVAEKVERFIVIEDDCLVSETFVEFAERVTDSYRNEARLGIVSAHNPAPSSDRYGLRIIAGTFPRIWGWATHSSVWKNFRNARESHSIDLPPVIRRIPFTSRIMFSALWKKREQIKSWDIAFVGYLLGAGLVSICASGNLVRNVGLEGGGTNSHLFGTAENPRQSKLRKIEQVPIAFPLRPSIKSLLREDFIRLFKWSLIAFRRPSVLKSVLIRRRNLSE